MYSDKIALCACMRVSAPHSCEGCDGGLCRGARATRPFDGESCAVKLHRCAFHSFLDDENDRIPCLRSMSHRHTSKKSYPLFALLCYDVFVLVVRDARYAFLF